jgi:hypothetical protein
LEKVARALIGVGALDGANTVISLKIFFSRTCWPNSILLNTNHPWLGWLFIVLRPAQEYFTSMETSPLPVKDCKI